MPNPEIIGIILNHSKDNRRVVLGVQKNKLLYHICLSDDFEIYIIYLFRHMYNNYRTHKIPLRKVNTILNFKIIQRTTHQRVKLRLKRVTLTKKLIRF